MSWRAWPCWIRLLPEIRGKKLVASWLEGQTLRIAGPGYPCFEIAKLKPAWRVFTHCKENVQHRKKFEVHTVWQVNLLRTNPEWSRDNHFILATVINLFCPGLANLKRKWPTHPVDAWRQACKRKWWVGGDKELPPGLSLERLVFPGTTPQMLPEKVRYQACVWIVKVFLSKSVYQRSRTWTTWIPLIFQHMYITSQGWTSVTVTQDASQRWRWQTVSSHFKKNTAPCTWGLTQRPYGPFWRRPTVPNEGVGWLLKWLYSRSKQII